MHRAAVLLHIPVYALALVGFFAGGRWVTHSLVRNDDVRASRTESAVASSAMELTYSMLDHPIQRLMIPDWKVVDVRLEPGHCDDPAPSQDARDYVADVRLYTLYAIPWRTATIRCGGWLW